MRSTQGVSTIPDVSSQILGVAQRDVIPDILEGLVEHLQKKEKINLAETFIDVTFVEAKTR